MIKKFFRPIYKPFFRSCDIAKCFFTIWPPYLKNNFRMIKYLPGWFYSFRPKANPIKDGVPFMEYGVIEWLNSFLGKDMSIFEWGSGGSTIYIAKRVKKIISVEHDPEYHQYISQFLKKNNLSNYEHIFKNPEDYCRAIDNYPDNFFDLILVDGTQRADCIKYAVNKVRHQGYILLDNSDDPANIQGIFPFLEGWKRRDFSGPKGYKPYCRYQTTIWQKS